MSNFVMTSQPSSNFNKFREIFRASKNVAVLTGAGVSAESGVPTFRGAGGIWRTYKAEFLATPEAFAKNPSLVWEFYHYRRERLFNSIVPNPAHLALTDAQKKLESEGKNLTVITQNIDGLHIKAGTKDIIELHGNLMKTRCTKCHKVAYNTNSPICESLAGRGKPDPEETDARIPVDKLPRCDSCSGLCRPHIVWFGESLESSVLKRAYDTMQKCDLCLVVGTSSVVYPAAMFAPEASSRGVPVAEFNIETTPATENFAYHFEGPCGETLPKAIIFDE